MKHINKIPAVAAFMLLIGIPAGAAQTQGSFDRTYTLPTFTVEGVSDPVLQSYVTPRIPSYLVGAEITMYYTIDEQGNVRGVRSGSPFFTYSDLDAIMTNTLRNWKFEPATNASGEAVAIKVAMPVKVVPHGSNSSGYASITIKGMKLTAKTG